MDSTKPIVKLDWRRLLGFDQATPQARSHEAVRDRRLAKLGAKVGGKPARLSARGLRGLTKIGGKVGGKVARRSGS